MRHSDFSIGEALASDNEFPLSGERFGWAARRVDEWPRATHTVQGPVIGQFNRSQEKRRYRAGSRLV
jgi:hypothetical protein